MSEYIDIAIVGSGPIGIACGVEAERQGLRSAIFEKGALLDSLQKFPKNLVFFSTSNLLEIGGVPFISNTPKPTRTEILTYYTRVAHSYKLRMHLYEGITEVKPLGEGFYLKSARGREVRARYVIMAIGFYDFPNMLNIPGEDLRKVSHFYDEAHSYYGQKVAIIGGQNSAAECALELCRYGSEVTLIHRREELGKSIKYWVRPDILNRIKEGSVKAYFNSNVLEIRDRTIVVQEGDAAPFELENDFVLAMTGYHPDFGFLESAGVRVNPDGQIPEYNRETMESDQPDLYIAGVVAGGKRDSNKVFIENGREHAKMIVGDILRKLGRNA